MEGNMKYFNIFDTQRNKYLRSFFYMFTNNDVESVRHYFEESELNQNRCQIHVATSMFEPSSFEVVGFSELSFIIQQQEDELTQTKSRFVKKINRRRFKKGQRSIKQYGFKNKAKIYNRVVDSNKFLEGLGVYIPEYGIVDLDVLSRGKSRILQRTWKKFRKNQYKNKKRC